MNGLIHVYCGDGKGKTTAAVGLSVRAIGNKIPVVFTQFLKDDSSGEIGVLNRFDQVEVLHAKEHFGFYKFMTEDQKIKAKIHYTQLLKESIAKAIEYSMNNENNLDKVGAVLILDELIGTYNNHLIDSKELIEFLTTKPHNLEVVLTGREPAKELLELADYVSQVNKIKHPFDQHIAARTGIEQ